MSYSYDRRTASDPAHVSRMLKEMLHLLPGSHGDVTKFRAAVQAYLKAAHDLDHEDEEVMTELADPILLDKLGELAKHLVEAEKLMGWLAKYNPHDPH